jgi:hypothetical protein
MPAAHRRSPGRRLVLTLAALTSLIGGYYLGQAWQRQPLTGLAAVVYPNGREIRMPRLPGAETGVTGSAWRLFSVMDTSAAACGSLRRDYALMMNRLATRPDIQRRLRLTVLAYDHPDSASAEGFAAGHDWIEVISEPASDLDGVSAQLGLLPTGTAWCEPTQDNAVLVSPDAIAWALVPREPPATMAHTVTTLIDFVE